MSPATAAMNSRCWSAIRVTASPSMTSDAACSAAWPNRWRFAAEPPVRKSRRVAQVSFVFLCVMALIGGGTWLAKRYIHASTADREAAEREKERLAKTEAARKGKVFVFDAKDSAPAQEPAPTTNLPPTQIPPHGATRRSACGAS